MLQQERHSGEAAAPRALVLGAMPLNADPASTLAAGPWCFTGHEDFFPDWEERFSFAPEPFRDRRLQARAICEAETLAADMIPVLARYLSPCSNLPESYWEFLLAPYAISTAQMVVEIWHRVQALTAAEGLSPMTVELLPDDCAFHMGTDSDVVLHGALNPACVHWIFSRLLRPVCPRAWKVSEAEPVSESWPVPQPDGLRARIRDLTRSLALRLPVPPLKGISLAQSLRWSLALMHPSSAMDGSRSLRGHFSSAAGGPSPDLPVDILPVFTALLPRTVRDLVHPASVRPMRSPRTRLVGTRIYEDARYRQRIAVWRARGGRVAFMQHGGNYGMMRHVSAAEFVEYSQHAFITWGWSIHRGPCPERSGDGIFVPLPSPQLWRTRNAWRGGSPSIIFVGTEMPGFAYQLDMHPTPLQNVEYREDKLWMLEALGRRRRDVTLYRPYFPVPGTLDDAPWLLPQFPHVHLCSGPLLPQMLECRLLILDHHGTTLLEAMAANVPTVCYWQPSHWPVTPLFQRVILAMGEAGIWHSSPEAAGVHINEVWPFLTAWWQSDRVQEARRLFLDTFAQCPEQIDSQWTAALRRL